MATLHHNHSDSPDRGAIYVKGAPERILEMCSFELSNNQSIKLNHDYWNKNIQSLAKQGYRIIAIAFKKTPVEKQALLFEDVSNDLTLIAVFALIDAPRIEVAEAVEQCYSAGIKEKINTDIEAKLTALIQMINKYASNDQLLALTIAIQKQIDKHPLFKSLITDLKII